MSRSNPSTLFPYLEVTGPGGEHFRVEITGERVTIGRYKEFNDIGLDPDPHRSGPLA